MTPSAPAPSSIAALAAFESAHEKLAPDIRDTPWCANCAGEVFVALSNGEHGVRIGHFQGDALLAAFVVAAHNARLSQQGQPPAF